MRYDYVIQAEGLDKYIQTAFDGDHVRVTSRALFAMTFDCYQEAADFIRILINDEDIYYLYDQDTGTQIYGSPQSNWTGKLIPKERSYE